MYANGSHVDPGNYTYLGSKHAPPVELHGVRCRIGEHMTVIIRDEHGVVFYMRSFERYQHHGQLHWRPTRAPRHYHRDPEAVRQEREAVAEKQRETARTLMEARLREQELRRKEKQDLDAKREHFVSLLNHYVDQRQAREHERKKRAKKRASWNF